MLDTPSVLAVRPGTKLSKADRTALAAVGIVAISIAPEDVAAIQSVNILPANHMLRCALDVINSTNGYTANVRNTLRAEFGRRIIESYLALGAASPPETTER